MICWSCEKAAGVGEFCAACGALQPPDRAIDHFAVLGVAPGFAVDLGDLERRYKDAARRLHPDKFVRSDPRARRASLARSVQLNDAWKALRDPVKRAEYLLSLAGIEVGGEEGTTRQRPAGAESADGPGATREKVPVPQHLLLDVLELREGLLDARAEGDDEEVRRLTAQVRERRGAAMAKVAAAFAAVPADIDGAASELVAVRYFDRFLAEVALGESVDAEVSTGSNHAG